MKVLSFALDIALIMQYESSSFSGLKVMTKIKVFEK